MSSRKVAARTVVRVSSDAFLTMALAAAEAAIASPDFNRQSYKLLAAWDKERGNLPIRKAPMPPSLVVSETGLETGGALFGWVERSKTCTEYVIVRSMTTTAIASDEALAQSEISPSLLADLCEAAGKPFGTVVGDWHSHPTLEASSRDIEAQALYAPSDLDLEGPNPPHCEISLIITVAWAGRSKPKNAERPGLVFRRVGELAFYMTAYSRGRKWSVADPSVEIRLV